MGHDVKYKFFAESLTAKAVFVIGAIILCGVAAGCFSPRKNPVNFIKDQLGFSEENFKESLYSIQWSHRQEEGQRYYVRLTLTLPEPYVYDAANSRKRDIAILSSLERIFFNAPYGKVQIENSTDIQSNSSVWTNIGYMADKPFYDSFEMKAALFEDCQQYAGSTNKPYFTALEKSIFRLTFMVDLGNEAYMISSINGVNTFKCAEGNTFQSISIPDENISFSIRNQDEGSLEYFFSMLVGNIPYREKTPSSDNNTSLESGLEDSNNDLSIENPDAGGFTRTIVLQSQRMNGPDVSMLQNRLLSLGFTEIGEADGYYGQLSEGAIKNIQKFLGFAQNGKVDKSLWNVLFSDANNVLLANIAIIGKYNIKTMTEEEGSYGTNIYRYDGEKKIADFTIGGDGVYSRFYCYFISDSYYFIVNTETRYGENIEKIFLCDENQLYAIVNGRFTETTDIDIDLLSERIN
jgi:hypothetical protein